MTQLELGLEAKRKVEPGLARHTDPDTSKEAAKSINVNPLEQLVVNYLYEHGASTTEEVCAGLSMEWKTISPRFRPLVNKGKIHEVGTAIASTNRRVIVWDIRRD